MQSLFWATTCPNKNHRVSLLKKEVRHLGTISIFSNIITNFCSSLGVSKLQPRGQIHLSSVFVCKVLFPQPCLFFCIVRDCVWTTKAELNSCSRDYMACKEYLLSDPLQKRKKFADTDDKNQVSSVHATSNMSLHLICGFFLHPFLKQ